jgi:hypothetical protein
VELLYDVLVLIDAPGYLLLSAAMTWALGWAARLPIAPVAGSSSRAFFALRFFTFAASLSFACS